MTDIDVEINTLQNQTNNINITLADEITLINSLNQTVINQNVTLSNMTANYTDFEERLTAVENEELVNSAAIHHNSQLIDWNTANITALWNQTVPTNLTNQVIQNTADIANLTSEFSSVISWNVTGVEELTDEVDANSAKISTNTASISSLDSRVSDFESQEEISNYFTTRTICPSSSNYLVGQFTLYAGQSVDFEATLSMLNSGGAYFHLYLYQGSSVVAYSYGENDNGRSSGSSIDIMYRSPSPVTSTTSF